GAGATVGATLAAAAPAVDTPALHDALPIFISSCRWLPITAAACWDSAWCCRWASSMACWICTFGSAYSSTLDENSAIRYFQAFRSEEHTSELQSRANLVCRLPLAKKTAGPA